jgi:actin-related protein
MPPTFDDLDDDEKEEKARVMAAAAAKSKEKARLALEAQTKKAQEKEEQKAKEEEEAKAAEAKAWAEAKATLAEREAQKAADEDKAKKALTPGELVLQAIDQLAIQVTESDEHVQRCERLQKVRAYYARTHACVRHVLSRATAVLVDSAASPAPALAPPDLPQVLGADTATAMRKRARKKSKDLEEQLEKLMDGALEEAFKQFDTDGSGTLDADELIAAYKAAGMPVNELTLATTMKLLDNNGDGVIDFDEFKQIAVKLKKSAAAE